MTCPSCRRFTIPARHSHTGQSACPCSFSVQTLPSQGEMNAWDRLHKNCMPFPVKRRDCLEEDEYCLLGQNITYNVDVTQGTGALQHCTHMLFSGSSVQNVVFSMALPHKGGRSIHPCLNFDVFTHVLTNVRPSPPSRARPSARQPLCGTYPEHLVRHWAQDPPSLFARPISVTT